MTGFPREQFLVKNEQFVGVRTVKVGIASPGGGSGVLVVRDWVKEEIRLPALRAMGKSAPFRPLSP